MGWKSMIIIATYFQEMPEVGFALCFKGWCQMCGWPQRKGMNRHLCHAWCLIRYNCPIFRFPMWLQCVIPWKSLKSLNRMESPGLTLVNTDNIQLVQKVISVENMCTIIRVLYQGSLQTSLKFLFTNFVASYIISCLSMQGQVREGLQQNV